MSRFLHRNFLACEHRFERIFGKGVFPVAKLAAVAQHAFVVDDHSSCRNADPKDIRRRTRRIERDRKPTICSPMHPLAKDDSLHNRDLLGSPRNPHDEVECVEK